MLNIEKPRRSLYTTLVLVVVSTVLVIMTIQSVFDYFSAKEKTIEQMKQSARQSIVALENNVGRYMASYAVNEYDKLIQTEMEKIDNLAIIVEDYNMGKILGEDAYISGKIRDKKGKIVEYEKQDARQRQLLKNSFYSEKYEIANSSDANLGAITIYKSGYLMDKKLNEIIVQSIFDALIISLLLIAALFFSLRFFLLKPLSSIVGAIVNSDVDGIPKRRIPDFGSREISALSKTMNNMIDAIKESRILLTQQRDELKEQDDQLRTLFLATEQSPVSILICNSENLVEYVNPQFEKTSGYNEDDVLGYPVEHLLQRSNLAEGGVADIKSNLLAGKSWVGEISPVSKQGRRYNVRLSASPIYADDGLASHCVYVIEDITEQKNNEQYLRKTQKMDALGKLTGGIAHDYNNLLGIIQGYADQLVDNLNDDPRLLKYARDIQHAAERGSRLSKKLLTFSRHKSPDATVLNVSKLIKSQQNMLESTLTARYKITLDLQDDLWNVELDDGELEDAILNMSINAMHAMEQGGEILFKTRNEKLTENDARQLNLEAGDYVVLSVSDTGSGMEKAVREKIFDPYFTTKGDRGTGLGLSQVYGFVERSGGTINVYSEPGHGSCFLLYFPRSHKSYSIDKPQPGDNVVDVRGNETLLVVDDENAMLELADDIFTAQGYRVLTAADGEQALAVLEKEKVDLILSDVIMPKMDGYELAAKAAQRYPHVKFQLVSGFADERHRSMVDDELHKNMLQKPYRSNLLLSRIRYLLDEGEKKNNLAGCRILVVDDEDDVQYLFKLNLGKLGCKVLSAANSDEALSLYQQSLENGKPINVIIMDLSIPGDLDGKATAEKIRALDSAAKIIVSSGHSQGPEMTNYKDFGFDASLEKNFDREKIERVLEDVLG